MKILHIDSSARLESSLSRKLTSYMVNELKKKTQKEVIYRDVGRAVGLSFVNDTIVGALFIPDNERSLFQKEELKASDEIIHEAMDSDVWVIGIPIYNFSMPATLKTWADMLARLKVTFHYTEKGPEGLLKGRKVFAIVTSGGTEIDSEIDFLTPWFRHFMKFIGIEDLIIVRPDKKSIGTALENL
jgi:FMN-dependent NADH-azoreductase